MAAPRNVITLCFNVVSMTSSFVDKIKKTLNEMPLREDFAAHYGLPSFFGDFEHVNNPSDADIILTFQRLDRPILNTADDYNYIGRHKLNHAISKELFIGITNDVFGKEKHGFLTVINQSQTKSRKNSTPIDLNTLFDMIMSMIEFKLNKVLSKELENYNSKLVNIQNNVVGAVFYIPIALLEMPLVEHLVIDNNNIKRIQFLDGLTNLQYLNLSNNQIEKIENLENNKELVKLNLLQNNIAAIENISHLSNLQNLYLAFNQIENTDGLASIKQLDQLTINNNPLVQIDALSNMQSVRLLTLSNTPIKSIKPIQHLIEQGSIIETGKPNINPQKSYIFLDGCYQLEDPNFETLTQGNEAVLKYWQETATIGTEKVDFLKLILLGNSRVGKTDFSSFVRTGEIQAHSVSTHLLEIKDWQPAFLGNTEHENLSVKIFDFGGQDYYHDVYRLFFSTNAAYIVLWETATNCYDEATETIGENKVLKYENYPINYWLETISHFVKRQSYGPDFDTIQFTKAGDDSQLMGKLLAQQTPVLLLQNKIDSDKSFLNQKALQEQYGLVTQFFDVALKHNQRTGILNEVLKDFISNMTLTSKNLRPYEAALVEYWKTISEQNLEIYSIESFLDKCRQSKVATPEDFNLDNARIIASVMNTAGYMLYEPNLDLVFTNLPQLNETIKSILELAKQDSCNGIIDLETIKENEIDDRIIALLEALKLLIKLNDAQYLNAQFLPTKPHPNIQFFLDSFLHNHVQFEYPAFFNNAILTQLFVQFLQEDFINEKVVVEHLPIWKYGIVIKQQSEGTKEWVYVALEKEASKGVIKIWTVHPFDRNKLEGKIMDAIEQLNEGWTVVKQISIDSLNFIDAKEILEHASNKKFMTYVDNKPTPISKFKNILDFSNTALPKKMFISYCSANSKHMHQLSKNLKILQDANLLDFWYDRMIQPGTAWDESIQKELQESDVILFMVSSDFLLSKYIMAKEVPTAIELAKNKGKKLEMILVEDCLFEDTIISQSQLVTEKGVEKKIFKILDPTDQSKWKEYINHLKSVLQ